MTGCPTPWRRNTTTISRSRSQIQHQPLALAAGAADHRRSALMLRSALSVPAQQARTSVRASRSMGAGHARPPAALLLPGALCSMWSPPFRKLRQTCKVSADQRFLLCARPALDLSLGRNRVGDPLEPPRKYQSHRATFCRVTAECSGIVLRHSPLKACTRGAGVIAAISTKQDVEESTVRHGPPPPFETRPDNHLFPLLFGAMGAPRGEGGKGAAQASSEHHRQVRKSGLDRPPPHKSSTSRSLLQPAQQIMTLVLEACSSSVRMASRCSGSPEMTRCSQAPQMPSSQE